MERLITAEAQRLEDSRNREAHWKRWGPYLSERAWGTVREDYSVGGDAWNYLSHDHSRSVAYRWNEDGIGGISDRRQLLCFALAMWNGADPILKERLFGVTGPEGNHGEDVKEQYFYLDSTPTHSYMKYLYKYPQGSFPYDRLLHESISRGRTDPEFELADTGIFDEGRYFDVQVEYAKLAPEDVLIRVSATNRGPERATLDLLPTLWYRNTWSWNDGEPPAVRRDGNALIAGGLYFGDRRLYFDGAPEVLFTGNETHNERLYQSASRTPYVKDAFHRYVVNGEAGAVNPGGTGSKAALRYRLDIEPGATAGIMLRLTDLELAAPFDSSFDEGFGTRLREADEFYQTVIPADKSDDARNVMRQAFAGLLWSKQFYNYVVRDWMAGDAALPPPPVERRSGRNTQWSHLFASDVISMSDKWEYPWFAAWDLAFHALPLALLDAEFAKEQLSLMVREWYMHPTGQLPAYEWNFGDVNPPVHAWASWRVYKIEKKRRGEGDHAFLEHLFHKLLLNFTWWVNRKDTEGRNVFQGGFLGLDNIGVFDRSQPLPMGGIIEQADGTGWMAMYSLNLLAIAMELSRVDPAYEHVASKFWEHFLYIANAITHIGSNGFSLWDEQDGFFYDVLRMPDGRYEPLKVRSLVGLIPLLAVETLEGADVDRLPGFKRRMEWFIANRPDLTANVAEMNVPGEGARRLMAVVDENQLRRVLSYAFDEDEFLSPYGIRSLSKYHQQNPFVIHADGREYRVDYEPGDSTNGLFGGNSNWRGPVWFPINFLLIEALQRFHHYYGENFKIEFPTRSGNWLCLWDVSLELARRMTRLFLRNEQGRRPANGGPSRFDDDPAWRDLVLFYEFFDGDTGRGLGANHQTGWTALVAKLMQQCGE